MKCPEQIRPHPLPSNITPWFKPLSSPAWTGTVASSLVSLFPPCLPTVHSPHSHQRCPAKPSKSDHTCPPLRIFLQLSSRAEKQPKSSLWPTRGCVIFHWPLWQLQTPYYSLLSLPLTPLWPLLSLLLNPSSGPLHWLFPSAWNILSLDILLANFSRSFKVFAETLFFL